MKFSAKEKLIEFHEIFEARFFSLEIFTEIFRHCLRVA